MPEYTVGVTVGTDDRWAGRRHTSYPPTAGTLTHNAGGGSVISTRSYVNPTTTPEYWGRCGLWHFDTSVVPDTETVTGAIFRFKVSASPQANEARAFVLDHPTTVSGNANDWTHDPPASPFASILLTNFVNGTVHDMAVDPAAINKTGTTYVRGHITKVGADDPPAGVNEVSIDSFDLAGGVPAQLIVTTSAVTDTTAPTTPTGLAATSVVSPVLTWTASTDDVGVSEYRIERRSVTDATAFAQIGTAPQAASPTYTDTAAPSGKDLAYRVRAADAAGNLSAYSNEATATTPTIEALRPNATAVVSNFTDGDFTKIDQDPDDATITDVGLSPVIDP